MKNSVSIFVSFHKLCELYNSRTVIPIQTETEINGVIDKKQLRDNAGDNISDKRGYCELRAQYWAWKNTESDYYGFMHYRRFFSFAEKEFEEDQFGNIVYSRLNNDTLKELNYDDDYIEDFVSRYDVISVKPQNVRKLDGSASVYDHYRKSPHHRIKDLDTVIRIIKEKYPEYTKSTETYLNGKYAYFCNMFILKKDIFRNYCSWLFEILFEFERVTDFTDYDINEYRAPGFLAERLWGIYLTQLLNDKNLKHCELQKAFFINTEKAPSILPAFKEKNVPIAISSSDEYVPYITVMIRSLIENANSDLNYDLIVLNTSITAKHKKEIFNEFAKNSNLSIRFCDVSYMYSGIDLPTHFHIGVESYYRLLLQDILPHYDKILYIDSDLVVNDDISKLFNIDVSNYCLGAVRDIDMAGNYHRKDDDIIHYFSKTLKLRDPYHYFNAGVLILNLEEIRKQYTSEEILKTITKTEWLYMDQDIMNYLYEGKVKYIDISWNVFMNWKLDAMERMKIIMCAPYQLYLDYIEARKKPKIVHYAGFQKPWDATDCDMAEYFWKYANKTKVNQLLKQRSENLSNIPSNQTNSQVGQDPNQLKIAGLEDTLYINGFYIKMINKINKSFPKGSKKRELIKRIARRFVG